LLEPEDLEGAGVGETIRTAMVTVQVEAQEELQASMDSPEMVGAEEEEGTVPLTLSPKVAEAQELLELLLAVTLTSLVVVHREARVRTVTFRPTVDQEATVVSPRSWVLLS